MPIRAVSVPLRDSIGWRRNHARRLTLSRRRNEGRERSAPVVAGENPSGPRASAFSLAGQVPLIRRARPPPPLAEGQDPEWCRPSNRRNAVRVLKIACATAALPCPQKRPLASLPP